MDKTANAYRTISEAAAELNLPQHVLRFWETRFPQIKPLKRGGGRRYYRPDDIELLRAVQSLLYSQGYTIKGVQRILREQNLRLLLNASREAREQGLPIILHEPEPMFGTGDEASCREVEVKQTLDDNATGCFPSDALPSVFSGDIRQMLEVLLLEINACRQILDKERRG